jgi:hypothetical protein
MIFPTFIYGRRDVPRRPARSLFSFPSLIRAVSDPHHTIKGFRRHRIPPTKPTYYYDSIGERLWTLHIPLNTLCCWYFHIMPCGPTIPVALVAHFPRDETLLVNGSTRGVL